MSSKDDFLEAMESWANSDFFRSLSNYFDHLKSTGVSMHQAYALIFIHYRHSGKISDICEHMTVSAAAASQMVDRLEKSGLVERMTEPDDRRVRNVVLSERGEISTRQSIVARQRWVKEIPSELDKAQLDQISETLNFFSCQSTKDKRFQGKITDEKITAQSLKMDTRRFFDCYYRSSSLGDPMGCLQPHASPRGGGSA